MLRAKSGATIPAIMQATGWQEHSVRGFLSAVVHKRLGLDLTSEVKGGRRAGGDAAVCSPAWLS